MSVKYKAVEYLLDVFGEQIFNEKFITWLCQTISVRRHRLIQHSQKFQQNCLPKARNSLPTETHSLIYNYWFDDVNSVISNDSSSERSKVRVSKFKYMTEYKHMRSLADKNISQQDVTFKKTGNTKMHMTAHRRIYSRPLREMHQLFPTKYKDDNIQCSLSTFIKFKPFYVFPPSEREKESCLCKKCPNIHALLKGINNFRKIKKLAALTSVTEYLKLNLLYPNTVDNESFESLSASHPEFFNDKEISFYQFEKKVQQYFKDGIEKQYSHVARIDKKEKVNFIVQRLMVEGDSYLQHRSIVQNLNEKLPLIRAAFTGPYVELDFSQNLAMKPKLEAQDAHFSGKQYTLHCSIVEPDDPKYVYHLCDDIKHDPTYVHLVLEDIFDDKGYKDTYVIIKSDNASNQYKDLYAFASMHQLADKYNCTIIRIYGAAGHGKGLIDAMSSFGVKAILRRDIISLDKWFANSAEIVDYLSLRGDDRMKYVHIDEKYVDSVRQQRKGKPLPGYQKCHLFVYEPGTSNVLMREYLCSCEYYLNFEFSKCVSLTVSSVPVDTNEHEEECDLDDEYINNADGDQALHFFEFVEIPSYVAVISGKISEQLYIIRVTEKGKVTEKLNDHWNHVVLPGELYLKGNYLVKIVEEETIQGC